MMQEAEVTARVMPGCVKAEVGWLCLDCAKKENV